MRKSGPLVSIIIPCYNAAQWIGQAIDSCLNQLYQPIEVIVVDDGSTDQSLDVVRGYTESVPDTVRLLRQARQGAPRARNVGAQLANGAYVSFLDADDLLVDDCLSRLIQALENGNDVAYGDIEFVDADGKPMSVRDQAPHSNDSVVFSVEIGAWNSSRLFRRDVMDRCSWDVTLPCLQDYEILVNCAVHNFRFAHVPSVVAKIRLHNSPTRISVIASKSADAFETRARLNQQFANTLAQMGALTDHRKSAFHYSLLSIAVSLWRFGEYNKASQLFSQVNCKLARRSSCFKLFSYTSIASWAGLRTAGWAWQLRQHLRRVPG